ncbi:hypothetical protein GALMADRAFT_130755 [Galerina marginata CBS 339.88]|uniref:Branched-chain-amino-acid transaminase n=1 Tax=Galerina marginata (strain CBS 339.88) TaxID=685588 RepID=A0A067S6Y4_GALM3|nr:hypothetical protein GALMADRAFT_130755 [Galerina marginata CBS 339.88]
MAIEATLPSADASIAHVDDPPHHPTTVPSRNVAKLAELDATKLILKLTSNPKFPPKDLNSREFGEVKTDHMLIAKYDPALGWSAPEVVPYGPLNLDPASSCLHYSTTVFEGMRAYRGPDGEPLLFRPAENARRLLRSAERAALPSFNSGEFLKLLKQLIVVESQWIPSEPGQSLYIRPTMIGTRSTLGLQASDRAMLFVILAPTGASGAFPGSALSKSLSRARSESVSKPLMGKTVSIIAQGSAVRAWPGGAGNHKLGANYAPTLLPQLKAAREGWDQILWLNGETVTEAGSMNLFVVVKKEVETQDMDVITPPLDGTVLPGITRDSCLALLHAHSSSSLALPTIPRAQRLHVQERPFTMTELFAWANQGKLVEVFGVGTAVNVAPIGKIGWDLTGGKGGSVKVIETGEVRNVGMALAERLTEIRSGRGQWDGWSVRCDEGFKGSVRSMTRSHL